MHTFEIIKANPTIWKPPMIFSSSLGTPDLTTAEAWIRPCLRAVCYGRKSSSAAGVNVCIPQELKHDLTSCSPSSRSCG